MNKVVLFLVFLCLSPAWADSGNYISVNYAEKHATGLVFSKNFETFNRRAPRFSFLTAATSVPASFTLKRKAGPVEDQGQCGSCWDFALTSALRGTWITSGKDPGRLSFNYLLNCASTMQGCNGGDFTAADYLVTPKGAPAYGSDGSYTATQSQCQPETPMASSTAYHMLGDSDAGPSFKDIAYVVAVLHRPVAIDIAATDDFQNYASGTFDACNDNNPNDINHMVVIEGYDCGKSKDAQGNCVFDQNGNLPKGVGTYTIRNSWGDSWGDSGYITMEVTDSFSGKRCDAVATDALYFDVGQ